jgi:hypothetical protein
MSLVEPVSEYLGRWISGTLNIRADASIRELASKASPWVRDLMRYHITRHQFDGQMLRITTSDVRSGEVTGSEDRIITAVSDTELMDDDGRRYPVMNTRADGSRYHIGYDTLLTHILIRRSPTG